MMARLDTLAAAEAAREHHPTLYDRFEFVPDTDLEKTIHLPFGRGRDVPIADFLFYPYQNIVYHTGQINIPLSSNSRPYCLTRIEDTLV